MEVALGFAIAIAISLTGVGAGSMTHATLDFVVWNLPRHSGRHRAHFRGGGQDLLGSGLPGATTNQSQDVRLDAGRRCPGSLRRLVAAEFAKGCPVRARAVRCTWAADCFNGELSSLPNVSARKEKRNEGPFRASSLAYPSDRCGSWVLFSGCGCARVLASSGSDEVVGGRSSGNGSLLRIGRICDWKRYPFERGQLRWSASAQARDRRRDWCSCGLVAGRTSRANTNAACGAGNASNSRRAVSTAPAAGSAASAGSCVQQRAALSVRRPTSFGSFGPP